MHRAAARDTSDMAVASDIVAAQVLQDTGTADLTVMWDTIGWVAQEHPTGLAESIVHPFSMPFLYLSVRRQSNSAVKQVYSFSSPRSRT